MPGLLILAHAPLASALREVAAHVYPEGLDGLEALDVLSDWGADEVEGRLRALLASMGQAETLILCDVFGATPANAAERLADGVSVRIVAGVNVPMLWRALCYRREPLEALAARAATGGAQGVIALAGSRPQNQTLDTARPHDPTHAHHQQ